MGAGARMAAERDRWPEHWRVADLDMRGGASCSTCSSRPRSCGRWSRACAPRPPTARSQVLIGVTDRRVRARRAPRATETEPTCGVVDVTDCAPTAPRESRRSCRTSTGTSTFDLDEDVDRPHVGAHRRRRPSADARPDARGPPNGAVPRCEPAWLRGGRSRAGDAALVGSAAPAAQERGDGAAVGLAAATPSSPRRRARRPPCPRRRGTSPRRRRWRRSPRRPAPRAPTCPSPRSPWPRRSPRRRRHRRRRARRAPAWPASRSARRRRLQRRQRGEVGGRHRRARRPARRTPP